jgi:hypothetical protein
MKNGPVQNAAGGGGTETVIGTVFNSDGTVSPHAAVELLPCDFDPLVPDTFPGYGSVDTTDDSGGYAFNGLRAGTYTLSAKSLVYQTRALNPEVSVEKGVPTVCADTLRNPGTVFVVVPANADAANGYMYVPGTDIGAMINGNTDTLTLDSVPPGTIPMVCYAAKNTGGRDTMRVNVEVPAQGTVLVANSGWKFVKKIQLNTTSTGAQVAGNVRNFPVLVRLTKNNFTFTEAREDGRDIRFAKEDNTPLPYEIEHWDRSGEQGDLWVKVDTVFGNDSVRGIVMYWGASTSSATSLSNSAAVFDTSNSFQAVWHLGDNSQAITYDATANHFDGMPKNMAATSVIEGMIGIAKRFDGTSSYIQMPGTAYSALNFPEHGVYSVSAWAFADTLDYKFRMIVSKGDSQYNLEVMNNNDWEFAENENNIGWEVTNSPATAKKWTYVTGVRNGTSQYLYVDGVCTDSSIQILFPGTPRYTGFDIMIGKKVNSPDYFFKGMIDEVRISDVALSADWIKLCYMNQKQNDALVKMK